MSGTTVCGHCGSSISSEAHFCPSCGGATSPEPVSWFDRLCAAAVDLSLWVASSALLIRLGAKWWAILLTWVILAEIGYQLRGSIGKSFTRLSIPIKSRSQYYLRETVGKLASVATFGIGFLMVLSREHLALHDYVARTRVVRTGRTPRARQALISLCFILGLATCIYILARAYKTNTLPSTFMPQEPPSLQAIVSQLPAVVTIYVYDERRKSLGQGSGFLVTSDGICVTNFHVIRDALSADVKLGDGRLYQLIAVQGYDAERDIAIIQLGRRTGGGIEQASDLPYLTLANDKVKVGDHIATVGSPEGLSNSVADGIVSAIRTDDGESLLQISAPISPGSSGGPVFNFKGEVVAVTSFQLTVGQNLNFAIPVDEISKLRDERAHLSLDQVYWRVHLSPPARGATGGGQRGPEVTGTRSDRTEPLTGSFVGTVHNVTSDLTAAFGISVEQSGQVVFGCMGVRTPLYGSGPLEGTVRGGDVQFDVASPMFEIHFEGQRHGDHLSGTYRVLGPGVAPQDGEFLLERKDRKRLPENFNPQKDCPTDADMNR